MAPENREGLQETTLEPCAVCGVRMPADFMWRIGTALYCRRCGLDAAGGPDGTCPDCGQPKNTPITWTYCERCTAKRLSPDERTRLGESA